MKLIITAIFKWLFLAWAKDLTTHRFSREEGDLCLSRQELVGTRRQLRDPEPCVGEPSGRTCTRRAATLPQPPYSGPPAEESC